MAVTVSMAALASTAQTRSARILIEGSQPISLPWWPDEVAWSALAPTWKSIPRPGRYPLLVQEGAQLPVLTLGFIAAAPRPEHRSIESSAEPLLNTLKTAAADGSNVFFLLGAAYSKDPWKITDLSYTELQWTSTGSVSRAEVSVQLTRATFASFPRGPVK